MKLVFFSIFLFFSVLGLIYFFYLVQHVLFNKTSDFKNCYNLKIVGLKGNLKDIEFLIRKQIFKDKNSTNKTDLFFLDLGLNPETKKIVLKFCQAHNFKICEKKEVYDLLKQKIKKYEF